jgi:hypothetical protein
MLSSNLFTPQTHFKVPHGVILFRQERFRMGQMGYLTHKKAALLSSGRQISACF